jgi:hypothetical protein
MSGMRQETSENNNRTSVNGINSQKKTEKDLFDSAINDSESVIEEKSKKSQTIQPNESHVNNFISTKRRFKSGHIDSTSSVEPKFNDGKQSKDDFSLAGASKTTSQQDLSSTASSMNHFMHDEKKLQPNLFIFTRSCKTHRRVSAKTMNYANPVAGATTWLKSNAVIQQRS